MIKILVAGGANINHTKMVNQGPQTPLDMARESGYKVTERVLLDLGAIDTSSKRTRDADTAVKLLRFGDVVPNSYRYPKNYSLSEANAKAHDYSDLLAQQEGTNTAQKRAVSLASSLERDWKTVRLFLSSTFTDMQAERDHLVKQVIPVLKKRCAGRRLHLVEVDLRYVCILRLLIQLDGE